MEQLDFSQLGHQAGGLIAGVDEVGRGPLAGPVLAAAVILDPDRPIVGLADSKTLSAARREQLADAIRNNALDWVIGRAEVEEIDHINILRASLLAMQRCLDSLKLRPALVLVDGNHCPDTGYPVRAVAGGDRTVASIAAASIIAKVARDREMVELDQCYPGYGFAQHKGYPTPSHLAALSRLGVCPIHRRSFTPVRNVLSTD